MYKRPSTGDGGSKRTSEVLESTNNNKAINKAGPSCSTPRGDHPKRPRRETLPSKLKLTPSPSTSANVNTPALTSSSSLASKTTISTTASLVIDEDEDEEVEVEDKQPSQKLTQGNASPAAMRRHRTSGASFLRRFNEISPISFSKSSSATSASSSSSSAGTYEKSWNIIAIYESKPKQGSGRGCKAASYLVQWRGGGRLYPPSWVEEGKMDGAQVLIKLHHQHLSRFRQWTRSAANRGDLQLNLGFTREALEKEGEPVLSRKLYNLYAKMGGEQKEEKEEAFMKLLFACLKLVDALVAKKEAASKEEAAEWEKGSDEEYGVEDYRRLIRWSMDQLKK